MIKQVVSIIVIMIFVSCGSEMNRRYRRAKRLSRTEKMEKWEEAIEEYDEIIKMKVNAREYQSHIYRKLGKRHMQMEHWTDALHYYEKAAEILPNEGVLHCRMGVCYSQLSRSEDNEVKKMEMVRKAEQKYKMAVSLNSKLIDPYYGLGIIYFYVYKNYSKAIEYMAEVLRRSSEDFDGHFYLGRFYYETGESIKSLEFYKALLSLVPEKDPRYEQVKENIERIHNELQGGPQ